MKFGSSSGTEQKLLLALPAIGITSVALGLAFGSPERAQRSARVYGGPTDQPGIWASRVLVLEEKDGVDVPVAGLPIEVRVRSVGERLVQAKTGPDGWVDVAVPGIGADGVQALAITELGTRRELASGAPRFPLERFRAAPERGLPRDIAGKLRIEVESGVLAVPFAAQIQVSPRGVCAGAEALEWSGADVEPSPASPALRAEGARRFVLLIAQPVGFEVRPAEHVVTLTRSCTEHSGHENSVSVILPVVPGALFARRRGNVAQVWASATQEASAYFWASELGRGSGGRLPWKKRGDSLFAELPVPPAAAAERRYLVLTPSPDGRTPALVGYPMDGGGVTRDFRDGFLLNGEGQVALRERIRQGRLKTAILGYIAALIGLELLLFRIVVARADLALAEGFAAEGAPALAKVSRRAGPVIAAALVIATGLSLLLIWIAAADGPR